MMSMANSLEVRVPLLDYTVVNFAFSLPASFKMTNSESKKILKETFRDDLPKEIFFRKKKGFEVPLLKWMNTGLRSLIEDDLLEKNFINQQNIFDWQEIEKMKAEAKANEAADKEARAKVDKLNEADNLIFQSEKQLKEFGDKLPADKKATLEDAVNKLKEAHKSQDLAAVEIALTELNNAWQAASQDLYNASQQAGGAEQGGTSDNGNANAGGNAENVTDAEYEEVK